MCTTVHLWAGLTRPRTAQRTRDKATHRYRRDSQYCNRQLRRAAIAWSTRAYAVVVDAPSCPPSPLYRLLDDKLNFEDFLFLTLDGATSGGPAPSEATPARWADAATALPGK